MAGSNCVRIFLIVLNIFFLICGLAVLGLGIWVQVDKGDYVALADSDTGLTGSILLIAVGIVTALISIVGILGALKRSKVLLWIFFSVLAIIVIVQIVALIFGFVYRQKIEDEFNEDLLKTTKEYQVKGIDGVTDAWDWAQQKFECCGARNYTDWIFSTEAFNSDGLHNLVPDSCCKKRANNCGNFSSRPSVDESKIYTKGCEIELKEFIKDHLLTIGLTALFFLIIELVVIALTLILVLSIARSSKVV